MDCEGFYYVIRWNGRTPLNGKPEIKAEYYETEEQCKQRRMVENSLCPLKILSQYVIGEGYQFEIRHISKPTRQITKETLASIRRKRLVRKINKKYPLFADEFIADELEKKQNYYEGITDPEIKKLYDEAVQREKEDYQKFQEAVRSSY